MKKSIFGAAFQNPSEGDIHAECRKKPNEGDRDRRLHVLADVDARGLRHDTNVALSHEFQHGLAAGDVARKNCADRAGSCPRLP